MSPSPLRAPALDNSLAAALAAEELSRLGCAGVVICPGSRSTPLVAALVRHGGLPLSVLHDERSAGFFALGWARQRGAPVAIVTTSGTAVANLLPALVEADRERVPLLALTADRPAECQGTSANQTIDQVRLLGPVVRQVVDLPPPEELPTAAELLERLNDALHACRAPVPGPVHLNWRFRKPLEPEPVAGLAEVPGLGHWAHGRTPWRPQHAARRQPDGASLAAIRAAISTSQRGLVVAGEAWDDAEAAGARALATTLGWPLLADVLARQEANAPAADAPPPGTPAAASIVTQGAIVAKAGALPPPPDLVIWTGGALLSPELGDYLACAGQILRLDPLARPRLERMPPGQTFDFSPSALATALSADPGGVEPNPQPAPQAPGWAPSASALRAPWERLEAQARATLHDRLRAPSDGEASLSEPEIAAEVLASVADHGTLFVGNSMPVRDADLFRALASGRVRVLANRGASGIDGLLSTAAGLARAGEPTTALLGDLSLLYDVGSLSGIAQMALPLRLLAVDNGGGGIFDFLPIAQHQDWLDPFFYTPHRLDLCRLLEAYGVPARCVTSRDALRSALRAPISGLSAIVARSPRTGNVACHRDHYRALADALQQRAQ